MNRIRTIALAAVIAGGGLAVSAVGASAAVVCNADGDCWHTTAEYKYPPAVTLQIHPHDWKWGDHDKFRWREHDGRGYWHGDRWEEF
ncbi:MAG: hypothetical protein KGM42_14150 [Hyphomicrobiales bacterium]|nr:hypothetical protein [Hyphomicrobiales bacterium]